MRYAVQNRQLVQASCEMGTTPIRLGHPQHDLHQVDNWYNGLPDGRQQQMHPHLQENQYTGNLNSHKAPANSELMYDWPHN